MDLRSARDEMCPGHPKNHWDRVKNIKKNINKHTTNKLTDREAHFTDTVTCFNDECLRLLTCHD